MREIILQTYIISLPILLGYIVWLLKNQKKYRDANGKGTMLLLNITQSTQKLDIFRLTRIKRFVKYTKRIMRLEETGWERK